MAAIWRAGNFARLGLVAVGAAALAVITERRFLISPEQRQERAKP